MEFHSVIKITYTRGGGDDRSRRKEGKNCGTFRFIIWDPFSGDLEVRHLLEKRKGRKGG